MPKPPPPPPPTRANRWDPEAFQANAVKFLDSLCDNRAIGGHDLVQPETEYRSNALVYDPHVKRRGNCPHKSGTAVESCVTGETVAWICNECGEQMYDVRWVGRGN